MSNYEESGENGEVDFGEPPEEPVQPHSSTMQAALDAVRARSLSVENGRL